MKSYTLISFQSPFCAVHNTLDVFYSEKSRDSYLHNDLLVTGTSGRTYKLINFSLEGQKENFKNTFYIINFNVNCNETIKINNFCI